MPSTPFGRIASTGVCAGIIALGALACAAPSQKAQNIADPTSANGFVLHAPSPAQAPATAARGVACGTDPIIHFNMSDSPPKQGAWRDGDFQDPVNRFDTPETVAAIQKHNAAVQSACGGE